MADSVLLYEVYDGDGHLLYVTSDKGEALNEVSDDPDNYMKSREWLPVGG